MENQPVEDVVISSGSAGSVKSTPYLDRWGSNFVWFAGIWVALVGSTLLWYFLWKLPAIPVIGKDLAPDQVKVALETHQTLTEGLQKSLMGVFDLLVTKTALPVITLMLGYLFGKRQA